MMASQHEPPHRIDRTAESPEIPAGSGLMLRAGIPYADEDGVFRVPIHGAYNLAAPAPIHDIAVVAVFDGSPQVVSAPMSYEGPPVPEDTPPPGDEPPPGMLEGGWFNCEMREDFRLPPKGGKLYVSAHHGPLRSEVLTILVPPLP